MPSFRWQGQDWELPNIQPDTLPKIRPSPFISYFFAIESNKREPASSGNKHFLTEAYKTLLERKLGLKAGDDEMVKALHRWKEDKYWEVGHGGPGDTFSTRANPNSLLIPNSQTSLKCSGSGQNDSSEVTPEKQKQLECYFWRRDGECRFTEDECLYAHHDTGKIKEYNDFKDRGSTFRPHKSTPAPPVKKTECFFWAQNKCKFSAKDCMFAHYRVDERGSPEGRRCERRYDSPERFNHYDNTNDLPSKQLECYFWRRDGECKFTEEQCLYAHHTTGKVKEIPGQAKIMDREPDSRRFSLHTDKTPTEYAMPQPPSIQLSDLTLSAFFDLFCYTNPSARRDSPWETVLKMYQTYVLRNFGKDTGKHVLAAYARTKLPIPDDLLKKYTLQLDDELSKKAIQEPNPASDKSSDTVRNTTIKRRRSSDEDATLATPKRVKSEREPIVTPAGQEIARQPAHQPSMRDVDDLQQQVEEAPVRQSTRLYSPSMPYEALPLPKFNDTSTYNTRAEQAASVDELVSSISAEMAGNAARDLSHNSRPHANSLTGRSSALVSPTHLSATTREGQRAAATNTQAADTPHVNSVDSRNSRMHTEKNSLLGAVPSTTRTSSPPKTDKPVTSEKVSQRSHEGIKHPSPSSRGNDHADRFSSIGMVIKGQGAAPKETSINGTHHGDTNNAPKYLSNGHGPISHGARLMSDKNSASGGSEHQTPRLSHSHELIVAGEVNGHGMIPAATPGRASSQIANTFTYEEPSQEPLGAHIVRVEALLRGALMELETLKRAMR